MATALALGAAICWGVADFVGGLQARRRDVLTVLLVSQLTSLVVITAIVAARSADPPPAELALVGVGAGLAAAVGFYGLYALLAKGSMARVAPVLGTSVFVPVALGLLWGERITGPQALGSVVALSGVLLITGAKRRGERCGPGAPRGAVLLGVVTALSLGLTMAGTAAVAEHDACWAVLTVRGTAVTVLVLAALHLGTARTIGTLEIRDLRALMALGIVDISGGILWALATTSGTLSVAAVLGGVFPAVTVVLSVLLLKDRLEPGQALGVVLAVAGCGLAAA